MRDEQERSDEADEQRDERGRLYSVVAEGRRFYYVASLVDEVERLRVESERMAATLSDVFCEITGGRLSYPTYDARTIITEVNDRIDEYVREGIAEAESVAEVRSLRGVVQAVESGIRALHKNTGLSNGLGYVCDECEGNWSSGAGSVPPGCPTIRALDAALAAAADAPQPENEQCSATHERYGRCDLAAGHGERHTSDVGADGPDDPGYQWGVRGTDADPWPGPSPAVLSQPESPRLACPLCRLVDGHTRGCLENLAAGPAPAVLPQTPETKDQRPHDLGWFSLPLETRQAVEEQQRRKADYDSGRWCGECRWGHVEDPPCCFTVPPVSGVAGNPEEAGEK